MNVTCRKCGALVPDDHAFCTECGAVMAEEKSGPPRAENPPHLAATISAKYTPVQPTPARGTEAGGKRDERTHPAQQQGVTTPVKAKSSSALYFVLGLLAVLALGALLFYLLGIMWAE